MKLHLPYKLRKSLLACLAAVALPTTLSTTVGTASGLAAVWFAASGTAQAASPKTPESSEDELLSMDDLMLIAAGAVTWTASGPDAALTWDTTSTGWTTGSPFADGESVTFLGAGETINATITVGAAVTAGSLTIGDATAGNGATFTLTAGQNAATNTVTVTGAVTLNGGSGSNASDPLDRGYVLKLENVNFTAQGGIGGSGVNYGQQGMLIVGSGATVNVSGSIATVNNAAVSLVVNHLKVSGGTLNVTENATWVNTGWGNHSGTNVLTEVTDGGALTTKYFATPHSVSVTGANSRMTVEGNAVLNNFGRLTVKEGGAVTITGNLSGNKSNCAGVVTVGSHDDTGSTDGTLILGTDGTEATHRTYAVKVYGTGSTLTVHGNLSAVGSEADKDKDATHDTGIALEVMYGATATVSGNLTLENASDTVASGLNIGGEESGNTGSLTVGGNLTAGASVSVQGEGSTLTVGGTVTLTGSLVINNGTVTLSGGGTIGTVQLGGETGVNGGSFTISTGLSWAAGSSLTLGGSLQAITLGGAGWTDKLATALSGANNQKLTVTLGADFLTGANGNSFTLFTGEGVADFTQYFDVNVEALSATYAGLVFNEDGTLTWGGSGGVEPSPGGLVWNKASDDNIWGEGHNNWGENNGPWASGSDAVFSDDTGETITLSGAVTAGKMSVVKGAWTIQAATEGTNSLTISDTLAVANGAGLTVGANATAAKLTLTGAGTTVTFTGNHNVDMGAITLGADTKLILQGNQTWARDTGFTHYAAGDGEVVFMGMGVQTVGRSAAGILWAFTSNSEDENASHDLASLRLSTWKGGGENGADVHTTVYITGEMGNGTKHGLANIANIWVDAGNSLVLGCPALGTIGQERHRGATLHLAGDGSNDAYTNGKNADAALMLVGSNSEDNRRDVRWNIEATENTSISVTEEAATPPDKDQQFWTLLGKFYNNGKTVEKKGDKRLVLGESFTTSANAEGGDGSGTWKVSAGTLELAYTAAETMSGWTVELASGTLATTKDATLKALSGTGTLNVGGGTLTLTEGISATLTELTLGDGAVLDVTGGGSGFTIEGTWHWGKGSKLKLGAAVTLGDSVELTDGRTQKLTIDLSSDFLGGDVTKGTKQLFTSGFKADWVDYFTFLVDSQGFSADYYEDLKLDANGMLRWGKASENLYWGSGEGETNLTWGSGQFDSETNGGGTKTDWVPGSNVFFEAKDDTTHTVTLAGDITTGTFNTTGSGAKAKYTFTTGGTSPRLDVKGGMTVKNSEITFENGVILAVNNGISLTDSTMSVGDMGVEEGGISLNNSILSVTGEADIAGALTGGNDSILKVDGGHVTLHGSVAGFSGTLDTGTGGTITLSGTDTQVQAPVVGSGVLEVNSATGVTLTGQLGGENDKLTVKNSGVGELLITSGDIGADTSLSFGEGAGNIVLGDAGHAVKIGGSKAVDGTGTLVLRNVTLANGFGKGSASLVVDTAVTAQSAVRAVSAEEPTGGIVNVSGMNIGNLDGITVNEHGRLTGVNEGTYKVGKDKELTLHFTADNWGSESAADSLTPLIDGSGFNIELDSGDADAQGLHLRIKDSEIVEALRSAAGEEDEATLYLRALSGGTWNAKDAGVTVDWEEEGGLMDILVSAYEFTEDGLKITGSTRDIYIVMDGEHSDSATSNSPADLAEKLATVVTKGKTLTLNWSGVGTVRNLLGEENSHLVINDSDGQGLTVTLDNTYYKTLHDDRYPGDVTEAQGMDTEFGGTITGGKGVNIVKSGLGTLTVGGNYSVVGDTRIAEGALHLKGTENTLGSLTFAAGEGEKRELQLEGGKTSVGGITTGEGVSGAALKLTGGAELTLTGTSSMADAAISSEDNSGRLKLGKGASLSFTEGKGITGTAVEMKEAELDMGATQSTLTSLNGSGTLKSASGGTVTVGGGEFTGTLTGTGGTLVLKDKVTFTLENATGTGMNVKLGAGASLLVDVSGKTGASGETLVLGNIELGDGSMKVDYGKNGIGPNFVQGNIVSVGSGSLEFHSDGPIANGKVETGFTLGTGDWQDFLDGIKYTGVGNFVKDHVAERGENDKLVLNMTDAKENKFEREIPGAGKNAHAGAQMLWESLRELTLGDALFAVFANPTSDYARLVFALVQDIDNGQTTGLERTLTSVAGASISTLTPALAQDIHRQLTTIRNRTTGMSAEVPTDGYDEFPFWHAWIQAEGGYHKMDADGMEPGFTLHNWGGTVGVDADISRATTMGLAVTAMYGDLKPDAADSATGDLDTVYLSAFARTMRGAWSHTFVLSGGIAEAKLDRTVSYNGGSYRTRGDTDGYVVGALYEVGYTRLANKEGTVALQPIANVELRHTSLRGYTEKGSDAGVDVDDMDMTVLTLGAGARVQAAVGENAFNRSSVLEARLLAKADIGDRSGTATNAIIGHSKRAEVESAEVGAVGIETGVGISVPLGPQSGSIFADASLEWRDNWVSTNATLGYRINF